MGVVVIKDQLLAAIETARQAWMVTLGQADEPRGWFLSNDGDPMTCGIEKDDEMGRFEGDLEAVIDAARLAAAGDEYAKTALILHLLCNELRGLVWGDAYINTRLGPC